MATTRWHADGYSYRAAITIPSASTTADSFIWDPAAWFDAFWDTVLSTGYDVRFYTAAGVLTTHERATWVYASKSASFEVAYADVTGAATVAELYWVYWGNASATDTSVATPTVESVSAYMYTIDPRADGAGVLLEATREPPGSEAPTQRFSKTSYDYVRAWWRVTPLLGRSPGTAYDRALTPYSLHYVQFSATTGTGIYVAEVRDPADAPETPQGNVIIVEANDDLWVGILITDGTDGSDYTHSLRLKFTDNEPLGGSLGFLSESRALVQVRNPNE